jgi:NADPH:quinone reductase-like Zn-dependent oxidoreductase
MRAAVLTHYGDVDALEIRSVEDLRPKAGEVKLRVTAASLNAIDLKLLSGVLKEFFPLKLPAILGFDASGEVVELGEGATGFKTGDRVFGQVRHSHAEYATATVSALAPIPADLSPIDAAAIPVVALTGAQLIEEAVEPKPGARVLVTGALGSVGRVAVHVARRLQARVIAGVRGSRAAEAERLGVDEVLALDDAASIDRLGLVDAIADTVGGDLVARLVPRLRDGGVLASVVGEPAGVRKQITVRSIVAHADPRGLVELGQEVARGSLILPVTGRFSLDQVREAFRRARDGGKVLLTS